MNDDVKIHIEIGENLASVINNVIDTTHTTDQIDAVMNSIKEIYLGKKNHIAIPNNEMPQ